MNLKEQGIQIKTLIMRNDESVLCLHRPSRDGGTETSHRAHVGGGGSQVFDEIIMFGIRNSSYLG